MLKEQSENTSSDDTLNDLDNSPSSSPQSNESIMNQDIKGHQKQTSF